MTAGGGPVFGNLASLLRRTPVEPARRCPGCGGEKLLHMGRTANGEFRLLWCSHCGTIQNDAAKAADFAAFVPYRVEDKLPSTWKRR